MNQTLQDTIERQITVAAPKERVFNAITDPKQITAWFPDAVEGTFDAGERPVFDFGKYGRYQILVTAKDPFDYFAYRWSTHGPGHEDGFMGDVMQFPNTLVEFRLEEVPGGTSVKLKESGFASLPSTFAEKKFTDNSEGWEVMMGRLEALFASK